MSGERVPALEFDERGAAGDRAWSVRTREGKLGSGKNTRRFAAVDDLQLVRARQTDTAVVLTLPDGTEHDVDSAALGQRLSSLVGQPVTLAPETEVSHFDDGPVSLIARASVDAIAEHRGQPVEAVRFRPNIVIDGVPPFGEEQWIGKQVRIGTVVLLVELASARCVMVDSQTADLPAQPGNLLAVGRVNDTCLGVIATVVQPGVVHVGNRITVE